MKENKRVKYGWSNPITVENDWEYVKGKLTLLIKEDGDVSLYRGNKRVQLDIAPAGEFKTSDEFFEYLNGFMEKKGIVE